jgi:hypothetical protein
LALQKNGIRKFATARIAGTAERHSAARLRAVVASTEW